MPSAAGTYGMIASRANTSSGPLIKGKPVVITYTAGAPADFTPNLTPVYALTDLDFVDEKGNKDPRPGRAGRRFLAADHPARRSPVPREPIFRSSRSRRATKARSRFSARGSARPFRRHEICDEFVMGPLIAQTILQRELYVRTKFTFKLTWEYCLLDPMDIVTITDSNLGLSNYPVRIIEIEEDDKGLLVVHLRGAW